MRRRRRYTGLPRHGCRGPCNACCQRLECGIRRSWRRCDGAQAIESLAPEDDPLMAFFLAFDPSVASRMKKIRPSWMRLSQQMNDQ